MRSLGDSLNRHPRKAFGAQEPISSVNYAAAGFGSLNHTKFGAARTADQREFLLETIAGPEIDKLPVGDILARADSIYQFEVRPNEEDRLRTEARRLREEGLNISAIALKLGISKDRASGLLSG
jgi:hypothetical protein